LQPSLVERLGSMIVKILPDCRQEKVKVPRHRADGPPVNRTARLILATGVSLAVAVPVFGGVAAAAPSQSTTTTVETTITVRPGDSLAGLAWRHGVRLSALLRANSLQSTSIIHPGQSLVIPAGARVQTTPTTTPTVAASAGQGARASAVTTPPAAAGATSYVVQAGDALSSIAWRHGVTLGSLVKANNLTVTSLIVPGRQLNIPPATRPIPAAAISPAARPAAATPVAATAPAQPSAPTAQGSSLDAVLAYATAQVGKPYQFFSAGPETFDCSGLVVAAFRQIGMNVPHQSRALARLGTPVDWRTTPIAAGDLVFTSAVGDPALITHVGIALDSRRWVHAVGFGRTVSVTALPASDKIMAVQRITLP
jgi:LysM repeat protein